MTQIGLMQFLFKHFNSRFVAFELIERGRNHTISADLTEHSLKPLDNSRFIGYTSDNIPKFIKGDL